MRRSLTLAVAAILPAAGVVWTYRRHRTLEAYGVDLREAKRWKSLGLSPEQARTYQEVGPAFVESWPSSGFTFDQMDELVRHKILLEEAVAWRRAGMSVAVASEWGRYRLSPDDVRAWSAYGFRARAAYTCKSLGLTPDEATEAYERGEDPAIAAARRKRLASVTLDGAGGWSGPYPPRDAVPDPLLSWDDEEDGPKVEWWLTPHASRNGPT